MTPTKFCLVACVAMLLSGCGGDDGPAMSPVMGTVTFDGQPVKDGDILFVSDNPAFGSDAGKIVDGKFSLMAKHGKVKIKIMASRELAGPAKKGAMGEELKPTEQFIPPCYNDSTNLTADVPVKDPKGLELLLTSSGAKKGHSTPR